MHQIKVLQVFRGLAALSVVVFHASVSTTMFVQDVPATAASIFGKGWLGVDFFFVLSGFIIMYAHSGDASSPAAVRRYTFKRLVRIFPAYLPVSLVMILLHSQLSGVVQTDARDFSLLSSLLLLPADLPPILTVAWSLVHELLFYAVFLFFFLSRRLFLLALLSWAAAIIAANIVGEPANWLRYPLSLLNIEFMLGVLAAWAVKANIAASKPQWLIAGGIAVAVFAVALMGYYGAALLRIVFAAGLMVLIVGFSQWEKTRVFNWPRSLMALGNASYSIYLVHNPALSITQRLARHLGLHWALAMSFGVLVAVLLGYLYFLAVEKRALMFFRDRLRPKVDPLPGPA